MKMIKLSKVTLNADRISAVVTDSDQFDANGPIVPPGGSLVLLDGLPPIMLRADDTELLSHELHRFEGLAANRN